MPTGTTTTTTTTTEMSSGALDPARWTTSQELCLLQALTHYKPVGIHKHFRMLSIMNALQTSGTIPQPITDHPHVSTAEGVWKKLGSLYDLAALDEREDASFADVVAGEEGDEKTTEYWREFDLGGDFERDMWERRLAEDEEVWSDGGDVPDVRMRESTIGDSEDPRSSPVGSARGTRSSGRRAAGRRLTEVKLEESTAASGKGSRRTSKAATPSVKDEEDTEMHDADQDDEDGSGNDDEDSEQEESEADGRKAGRTTRARGGRRGRARRGRRGK